MNLTDVIEGLVEDRGLDRNKVISIVCAGIKTAYEKRFPSLAFVVSFNSKQGEIAVVTEKKVVPSVTSEEEEISLRRAKTIDTKAKVGSSILVPFPHKVGRIEILAARQVIASKIRELEQQVIHDEFKGREGTIINGIIHKQERGGFSVKLGEVMAFLPKCDTVSEENFRTGTPIKALLKEVLPLVRGDYQLILDRASNSLIFPVLT